MVVARCLTVVDHWFKLEPSVKEIEAGVEAATIVLAAIDNGHTVHLVKIERGVDLCLVSAVLKREVMLGREVLVVDHLVPPVGIGAIVGADVVLGILASRQHLRCVVCLAVRELVGIREIELTACVCAALCGDENHTRSSACAIDGTCRSILKHIDRGNVLLCERANVATGETVDNDERRTSCID